MVSRVCLIGLDPPEASEISQRYGRGVVVHPTLPKVMLRDGELLVERPNAAAFTQASKVVFHGIFADDHDLIAGLALWGGPCLPNAHAMMDCPLKLPCLVRALKHTRFAEPARGYVSGGVAFETDRPRVAKWGNWHCGENKARFDAATPRTGDENAIIENFLPGRAVRVVVIGDRAWQIALEGADWLKSIHDPAAAITEIDDDLLADTRAVADGFGLEVAANDYIITPDGAPHLLEVNHIPNVTRFPAIREAYLDYVVDWLSR